MKNQPGITQDWPFINLSPKQVNSLEHTRYNVMPKDESTPMYSV